MYLLSVSPVFAPELFPQNIYTDKPPVSPRAPSVPLCPWWESLWEQDVRGMFSSQLQAMRTGSRHGTGVPSSRCAHWQDQTGWHPGWDVTGPQWVLWPGPTDEACAGCWSPLQPLSPCFLLLFSLLTSQRVGFGFFFNQLLYISLFQKHIFLDICLAIYQLENYSYTSTGSCFCPQFVTGANSLQF